MNRSKAFDFVDGLSYFKLLIVIRHVKNLSRVFGGCKKRDSGNPPLNAFFKKNMKHIIYLGCIACSLKLCFLLILWN